MDNFIALVKDILENHNTRTPEQERTGTGTLSVFGRDLRYDISGFKVPMVTTSKISFDLIIKELLFFIKGGTNIKELMTQNCHIWDDWAVNEETPKKFFKSLVENELVNPEAYQIYMDSFDDGLYGEIGPMYGYNWRYWPRAPHYLSDQNGINPMEYKGWSIEEFGLDMEKMKAFHDCAKEEAGYGKISDFDTYCFQFFFSYVDQLMILIHNLKTNPYSRRHVVTAFNPSYTPIPGIEPDLQPLNGRGSLDPCHNFFQCYVKPPKEEGGKMQLSLKFNMRSTDALLGLPFNIPSYAILTHLLALQVGMEPDELLVSLGDVHIYANHVENAKIQVTRTPGPMPVLKVAEKCLADFHILEVTREDLSLEGYVPQAKISYERNV